MRLFIFYSALTVNLPKGAAYRMVSNGMKYGANRYEVSHFCNICLTTRRVPPIDA